LSSGSREDVRRELGAALEDERDALLAHDEDQRLVG
jgi:hypothetical protein